MSPNVKKSENHLKPVFKVIFRDEIDALRFRKRIDRFLRNLINVGEDNSTFHRDDLKLEIFGSRHNDSKVSNVTASSNSRTDICTDTCSDGEILDEQDNNSLFTVDTKPKVNDDLDIPMYGKKFLKTMDVLKEDIPKDPKDFQPKMTCFNCLGNHSLRDCPESHNRNQINKNRKEYHAKTGSRNARYHADEEQKFGHLEPGKMSVDLRNALGLKDNELPEHIYRMRQLGYPPGWLEEARLQHSGLSLFNSEGNAEIGEDEEVGEIISPEDRDQYDIMKIIEFPGFNIESPQGTIDHNMQYWGTDAQASHSKETMLLSLSNKKVEGYKRKRLPNPGNAKTNIPLSTREMDIDESDIADVVVENVSISGLFIPPLPKDDPKPPEPPEPESPQAIGEDSEIEILAVLTPPSPSSDDEDSELKGDRSLSLAELELTKQQLLAQLNESSLSNCGGLDTTQTDDEKSQNLTTTSELKSSSPLPCTPQNNRSQPIFSTPSTEKGQIKSVDFGTPILKSTSPYSILPSSEKFSKDICDVINFENLPDATGKYEQMSGLIQKVRTRLSELHKE